MPTQPRPISPEAVNQIKRLGVNPSRIWQSSFVVRFLSQVWVISPLDSNWNEVIPLGALKNSTSARYQMREHGSAYGVRIIHCTVVYEATKDPTNFTRFGLNTRGKVSLKEVKGINLQDFGLMSTFLDLRLFIRKGRSVDDASRNCRRPPQSVDFLVRGIAKDRLEDEGSEREMDIVRPRGFFRTIAPYIMKDRSGFGSVRAGIRKAAELTMIVEVGICPALYVTILSLSDVLGRNGSTILEPADWFATMITVVHPWYMVPLAAESDRTVSRYSSGLPCH